ALRPPGLAERFRRDEREVFETKRVRVYEEAMDLAGGRWVGLTTKFPLLDEDGNAYAVCGISLDVTDRKRAAEQLADEAQTTETLYRVGRTLAAELDLEKVVQFVTDE